MRSIPIERGTIHEQKKPPTGRRFDVDWLCSQGQKRCGLGVGFEASAGEVVVAAELREGIDHGPDGELGLTSGERGRSLGNATGGQSIGLRRHWWAMTAFANESFDPGILASDIRYWSQMIMWHEVRQLLASLSSLHERQGGKRLRDMLHVALESIASIDGAGVGLLQS